MKTFIGTEQDPYIDLTPHLDMAGLIALRLEIIKGIALSDQTFPSAYGTLLDPIKFKDGFHTAKLANESTDPNVRAIMLQIKSMPGEPETKRRRALLFSNLVYKGYSGGFSVPIRAVLGTLADTKNDVNQTRLTSNAMFFEPLLHWISKLPFASIGRITIFVNTPFAITPIHTDGYTVRHTNDMMWLSIDGKRMFIYDPETQEKFYINTTAAFFEETVHHGTDPSPFYQFSIRIDGVYTPEFKAKLGLDKLANYCARAE